MLTLPNSSSKKGGGNGPHRHTSRPVELFGSTSSLWLQRPEDASLMSRLCYILLGCAHDVFSIKGCLPGTTILLE
uniref:Uncharacterized protein n=1 Tax=Zea mays TaxID=4577 RepID=C4J780_MAIZE|nr:unknown [Zea mays]